MDHGHGGDILVGAGIIALTLTSATAVYRAAGEGDAGGSVAFVVVSYAALLLLLRLLRAHERAPPGDGEARERLKRGVWCLCTLLTAMFSWRVARVMPWRPAAVAVWALAVATSAAGFLMLFRRRPCELN